MRSLTRTFIPLLIPIAALAEQVILEPNAVADANAPEESLYIGDSLICNSKSCYPKVFEPTEEWKKILPEQQLPPGLDIRVNIDTGLKEAKLLDKAERKEQEPLPTSTVAIETTEKQAEVTQQPTVEEPTTTEEIISSTTSVTEPITTTPPPTNHQNNELVPVAVESPEQEEDSVSTAIDSTPVVESTINEPTTLSNEEANIEHEFSVQFNNIREHLEQPNPDYNDIESHLDDLIEFAHDFKYGYTIISNEFDILSNVSINSTYPLSLRDVSSRIIIGCLRNNPPVIEYVIEHFPNYPKQLFEMFQVAYANKVSASILIKHDIIIKRYISILDELLPQDYDFADVHLKSLSYIYRSLKNKNTKLKILELVSRLFSNEKELKNHTDPEIARKWSQEYSDYIQDSNVDEIHLKKFFTSIFNIKKMYRNMIEMDKSFMKWLDKQVEIRSKHLTANEYNGDVEQERFDKVLVDSRQYIFGSPNESKAAPQTTTPNDQTTAAAPGVTTGDDAIVEHAQQQAFVNDEF